MLGRYQAAGGNHAHPCQDVEVNRPSGQDFMPDHEDLSRFDRTQEFGRGDPARRQPQSGGHLDGMDRLVKQNDTGDNGGAGKVASEGRVIGRHDQSGFAAHLHALLGSPFRGVVRQDRVDDKDRAGPSAGR